MFPNQQQMPRQGNSPLNEGLALLLKKQKLTQEQQQLDRALQQMAQMGQVSPVGPDGKPTIAGQAMQPQGGPPGMGGPGMPPQGGPQGGPPGMPPQGGPQGPQGGPPGMQDVMQQAATGAQMQMAQMQGGGGPQGPEMPPQGPPPGMPPGMPPPMDQGIASAPGAQNVQMAEGGIVGYAGGPQDGSLVQYNPSGSAIGSSSGPRLLPDTTGYEGMSLPDFFGASQYTPTIPKEAGINAIKDWINRGRPSIEKPFIDSLIATLSSSGSDAEEASLAAYKDDSRQKDVYRAPTAAPAPVPVQAPAQQPDRFAEILKVIGGGGGAAPNLQRQLGSLINVGPAPQRPTAANYTEANRLLDLSQKTREGLQGPASAKDALPLIQEQTAAKRAYYESQGLDPDFFKSENERLKQATQKRTGEFDEQIQRIDTNKQNEALLSFLLGAKGRSVGEIFGSGAVSSINTQKSLEQKKEELQKARFDMLQAAMDKDRTLALARRAEADGDFKAGIDLKNQYINFANNEKIAKAQYEMKRAELAGLREEKAAEFNKDLFTTETTARTAAQGRAANAIIEQARLNQQAASDAMRFRVQVMLEQTKAHDSKLHQILTTDPVLSSLEKEIAELSKSVSPNAQNVVASKYDDMAKRINLLRKTHGAQEIPIETPIMGTASGQRAR